MSTATTEPQVEGEIHIPSDDEVKVSSGAGSWRFGNGKICKGRQEDNTLETKDSVTGLLTRVGFYNHKLDTGKQILKIECDLKLASGDTFHLGADLLDDNFQFRPSMSALQFAHALTQLTEANPIIKITCSKGEDYTDEMGRQRKGSTYVNVFRVDAKNNTIKVEWPKKDKSAARESVKERWLGFGIDEKIKSHPLYKEREKRESNSATSTPSSPAFEAFCNMCRKIGWPTPEQAANEWLGVFAQVMKANPPATLGHISESEWDAATKGMKAKFDAGITPKAIAEAKARLEATQQAALGDDYDPFADVE